jgi:hypothetical protein
MDAVTAQIGQAAGAVNAGGRDCNVFKRSMPPDLDPGWRPVRARKTRQYKKISRLLISIKPEAPAMVLMKAAALRSAAMP